MWMALLVIAIVAYTIYYNGASSICIRPVYIYTYIHTYVYIHTYIHVFLCIYIYIHITIYKHFASDPAQARRIPADPPLLPDAGLEGLGSLSEGGMKTVGKPHRAQPSQFEFFLCLWILRLCVDSSCLSLWRLFVCGLAEFRVGDSLCRLRLGWLSQV